MRGFWTRFCVDFGHDLTLPPERIRAIRVRENASLAVFARFLNVTAGLASQWERGQKRPRGASLKLLTLVEQNELDAVA